VLKLLYGLGTSVSSDEELAAFLVPASSKLQKSAASVKSHKKKAQEAWLAALKMKLTPDQRNQVLRSMVHDIVPWFPKVELLMDFLSDSFNQGGETSLLALAGLFYLMQEKNLDYSSFYEKLYSLLDGDLLHSKYRSRFFRQLDTFMASTHLPAALVASFIKRLSRLALQAPPSAIVLIIPWVYNMFKLHPTCTFMMHREPMVDDERDEANENGVKDTFDMDQANPMLSGAIDSDVWELVTLQSHYHPNVATLAKIISEQFTKQSYNLEDFLDHSYDTVSYTYCNSGEHADN
jgi:U3 small nucleolar RNA-associated protein 19